jgi:hypothetical protein
MTKKEAMRITHQENVLMQLGFTQAEAEQLRRISMTLQRWHELECGVDGGCVERDETTNKPYWVSEWGGRWTTGKRCRTPIADRETGARKRLSRILMDHLNRTKDADGTIKGPVLSAYIQTDPRGAALYIIRPGDIPDGKDVSAYYNRGICVY